MPRFVVNCCWDSNDGFPVVEMEDVPGFCPICGAHVFEADVCEEHRITAAEAGVE